MPIHALLILLVTLCTSSLSFSMDEKVRKTRVGQACQNCALIKKKCSMERPCQNCVRRRIKCLPQKYLLVSSEEKENATRWYIPPPVSPTPSETTAYSPYSESALLEHFQNLPEHLKPQFSEQLQRYRYARQQMELWKQEMENSQQAMTEMIDSNFISIFLNDD